MSSLTEEEQWELDRELCSACWNGKLLLAQQLVNQGANVNSKRDYGEFPLHCAAKGGHTKVVKYLLENTTAQVNAKDRDDKTVLHFAAEGGHTKVVKYLLENTTVQVNAKDEDEVLRSACKDGKLLLVEVLVKHGANVNYKRRYGDKTALHFAAEGGHTEVVKYLLENTTAEVDARYGKTALHLAAEGGHTEVVKYLLENTTAEVNTRDGDKTALHYAAEGGHTDVVKYLLENTTAEVNAKYRYHGNKTALHYAAEGGHTEVVKYLLENTTAEVHAKDSYCDKTALHYAAEGGRTEVVKYLLENTTAEVNTRYHGDKTALHYAAEGGRTEVVKYLLENTTAEVNAKDRDEELCSACRDGKLLLVQVLVKQGANVNHKRWDTNKTALHYAAEGGRTEVVKYLLENTTAEVNAKDRYGDKTALHFAAEGGRTEVVKYLLENTTAEVNAKDRDGDKTALHFAAKGGNTEVVKYLLENTTAEVNAKDRDYKTALHFAAEHGCTEVVKYLLENTTAQVNAKDRVDKTALHRAAEGGHTAVVKYLLENTTAQVDAKDYGNKTALHYAAEGGHTEVVKYLLENTTAEVNAESIYGRTPLDLARVYGRKAVVDVMVTHEISRHSYTAAVQRAMREGVTKVIIIKVLIIGPPGSGKTGIRYLLLGLPPPSKRTSTPLATRAARAISMYRFTTDGSGDLSWIELDEDTYLNFIAEEVKLLKLNPSRAVTLPTPTSPSHQTTTIVKEPDHTLSEDTSEDSSEECQPHSVMSVTEATSQVTSLSSAESTEDAIHVNVDQPMPSPDHTLSEDTSEDSPEERQPHPLMSVTETTPQVTSLSSPESTEDAVCVNNLPSGSTLHTVAEKMVLIGEKKPTKSSNKPQTKKTFVHLIDSGGQPAFISLVPAFVRGSTVNIVVSKQNHRLSDKLTYEYVIDDQHLRRPTQLEQTQLEAIEELVRSLSSVKHSKAGGGTSTTKFLLVGTHADKHWSWFDETLAGKNRWLKQSLGDLKSMCIEVSPDGDILLPVNTCIEKDRDKVASSIRKKILEACGGAGVSIPTRWYMFELEVSSKAKKEGRSVLGLVECEEIGNGLKMTRDEVINALAFLNDNGICLYFGKPRKDCEYSQKAATDTQEAVDHLVFTDSQVVLSEVTELLNLGIIDLQRIPSLYPLLSTCMHLVRRLREQGLFNRKLVEIMCAKYRVNVDGKCKYTLDDFLVILKHLLIIAPVTIDGEDFFFIPSILPINKKVSSLVGKLAPLVILCCTKVIPLGMFSALVVALLDDVLFTLRKILGRNAVSLCFKNEGVVLLVEAHACLVVHFKGDPSDAPLTRIAIHTAINKVCEQRQFDTEQIVFIDGFWCPFKQCESIPHQCKVNLTTGWLTCSLKPEIGFGRCTDEKMLPWIAPVVTHSADFSNSPVTEDCHPQPTPIPAQSPPSLVKSAPDLASQTGDTVSLIQFMDTVATEIPAKWKRMGVAVGMSQSQIDAVDFHRRGEPFDCFSDVFKHWQDTSTLEQPANWASLITVLRSQIVGEEELAERIQKTFL